MNASDAKRLLDKMSDELAEYFIQSALNFVNKLKAEFDSNELLAVSGHKEIDMRRRRIQFYI